MYDWNKKTDANRSVCSFFPQIGIDKRINKELNNLAESKMDSESEKSSQYPSLVNSVSDKQGTFLWFL